MVFPEDLKYTNDHEWIRIDANEAYIGITDYAQSELGEIVFVDVPTVDEPFLKGSIFGSIEAIKTVSDLLMPVAGHVLEVNPDLESQPELVNSDPYGKGWIIRINVSDEKELDVLMDAGAYRSFVGK
jgi:glycine cleavage system H protein